MLLELKDLNVAYGRHRVVHGVSLTVDKGELVALLGPNGVGKTTTLLATCGLVSASSGEVLLDGESTTTLGPVEMVRRGIVLCPQGRELFKSMTVRENLLLGAFSAARDRAGEDLLDRVYELFPRLRERERQLAGTMSGGEQQMIAIGRALMARPRVLLIDEPSSGLAPKMVETVLDLLRTLMPGDVEGILLVEQNADAALRIADRAYLMQAGLIQLQGSADTLRDNDAVREMYLGVTSAGQDLC
ncbi:MAG: ABC transporter ATP-binding protein [Betaproteobacteria bacterium]|nr:MAG: ABC transporter ATP-binding protein [Betaproteobacteria bacterium]